MSLQRTPAALALEWGLSHHGISGIPAAAICTRGRPALLRRALQSLDTQSLPLIEILVIDNMPAGDPATRAVAAEFPRARYVHEPRPGLDVARNRALSETGSRVIAFLDDDVVADRDWALFLHRVFQDGQVAACTGRVEAASVDRPGEALFEANGGFGRGRTRIELPRDAAKPLNGVRAPLIAWAVSIGCGCSLAVRRDAALEIGGFDVRLDRGEALPGGGDHDLLWRLLQAGRSVVYEPDALAWHQHRGEIREAIDQIAGHQRALVAFLTKSLTRAPLRRAPSIAAFLAWRLVKPGVRLIRRAAGRDPLPARALVSVWAACWLGLVSYRAAPPTSGARPGPQVPHHA